MSHTWINASQWMHASLHTQVLADLPPKIIQDVVCDLSPLQAALYEDFQASQVRRRMHLCTVLVGGQLKGVQEKNVYLPRSGKL